jgi:hypothetical protein
MFWLILIPVFGQPILDTGGESFRSNEGDIAESQFMFKAGLRASVSTGTQVACVDTDFATISTVCVAAVPSHVPCTAVKHTCHGYLTGRGWADSCHCH